MSGERLNLADNGHEKRGTFRAPFLIMFIFPQVCVP